MEYIEIIVMILVISFGTVAVEFYQTATLNVKKMAKTAIIFTTIIVFSTIVIDFGIFRPISNTRNRIGKECCLNMDGEINGNICKYKGLYMTNETDLETLGNSNTMEYQIYCVKNEKLINKLKGREE